MFAMHKIIKADTQPEKLSGIDQRNANMFDFLFYLPCFRDPRQSLDEMVQAKQSGLIIEGNAVG